MNERLSEMLNHKVTKRNDIIQNSRYSLSSVQNKTLSYMLSRILPDDKPEKIYKIFYSDVLKLLNWSDHGIADVKKIVKEIADASVFVNVNNNGKETLVRWLDLVNADENKGCVEYTFHKTVHPFVFNLQKQQEENGLYFSSITLRDSALMKNKYSPRVYEILKSYQFNNKTWKFEIGTGNKNDLFLMIADIDEKTGKSSVPESWYRYSEFDRTVLKKVEADINKYSDIKIKYAPLKVDFSGKKYRKFVALEFAMIEKSGSEKQETSALIDREYDRFLKQEESGQMTLGDFLQAQDSKVREEKKGKVKESLFKKRFPVFCAEFEDAGFTEKQLQQLQIFAVQNMHNPNIPKEHLDAWVTDYVDYYYKDIQNSENPTKTSIFARLRDCVENDYRGRGLAESMWERKEPEVVFDDAEETIDQVVEVLHGEVVMNDNDEMETEVNNGVDPVLDGVVFLSSSDKNCEYKENIYAAQGFSVQIVSQEVYLVIKNKYYNS